MHKIKKITVSAHEVLDLYLAPDDSITTVEIHQAAGSKVFYNLLLNDQSTGKKVCKVFLNGRGAEFTLRGLGVFHKNTVGGLILEIEHVVGETTSSVMYKSIVNDQAQSYFRGKIKVLPAAQETIGNLINKNLILGDNATVDALPELEVDADDVKCTHGSATGCLDQAALFYLQARGIERAAAERMLITAFAHDVFSDCQNALERDRFYAQI